MVSELVLFQLSSFCALIGMTLGWRGVMTKFAGFYDLPTAWNHVFWGIVLGGIYEQTQREDIEKVPFFGDLPYLSWLFKTTSIRDDKRELIIFVTPRILKDAGTAGL